MVETRRLKALTGDALQRLCLPDSSITVALSGGADSAALAFLASQAGADLDAVHVHHGFPASDVLAVAAQEIADQLVLDVKVVHVEVEPGPSPEGKAREARYGVLDSWPGAVVTAHTKDDNAETILMNLVRGAGAAGLSGIPRHRPPVTWRPMLDISRNETREIAALAGLPFVNDPMNDDETLARTRVRHSLLPMLREMNPRVDEALARAGASLDADAQLLDTLTPEVAGPVPVALLQTTPRPLASRVLMRMLTGEGLEPTDDRVRRMWAVVDGDAQRHDLAGGRTVVRSGALLVIE